jgi:hypothetical protein
MSGVMRVELGDGAVLSVQDPRNDINLEWQMRYGSAEDVRFQAASLLASYESLLQPDMRLGEAIRRLRLIRNAYRERLAADLEDGL